MKISLFQENLNKGLSIASRFISSHPQLPILNNIALKTEENQLKISATNLEIGVNYYTGGKIEQEGEVIVLAKPFLEFVSLLPLEKIFLTSKKESLNLVCGNHQATLSTGPVGDFPKVPTKVERKISFPYDDLIKAIKVVVFAASNEDSRPVLGGVNFKFSPNSCLLLATDGYRLSFRKIKINGDYSNLEFIIPATILIELLRLKPENKLINLDLGLANEEKQAVFFLPNLEFSSRLLEGEYPNIDKIIPQKKETMITVDREKLLETIRTASVFARESANTIKLEISEDKIRVLANTPSLGENISLIEAKIEGKKQRIAFNFRFLIDLLTNIESDQIIIELQESLGPAVFKNPKDKDFLHIIMPVKIQEE